MKIETYLELTRAKLPNCIALGGSVRLKFNEGGQIVVHPEGVTSDDIAADCTVTLSGETFEKMISGKQTPTAAFMMGKLKISGDMMLATKLGTVLTGNS